MSWRTAHNMLSSSLRKKSDLSLVSKVRCGLVRDLLANLQEIFLGTKLCILFPAIPLTIAANYFHLRRDGTSHYLKGLVPLLCYLAIGACFFVFKSPFEHQPTSSITRTAAVTEA